MPKDRLPADHFVKQVADTFRAARPTKRTLTQQTGDAGNQFGQKFVNPMDDVGQMISGGESGALEKVPEGTEGQVVTMVDVGGGVLKPRMADSGAHDPVTVTDSASIDLTLTGQDVSAAVILEWLQDTVAAILTGGSHTNVTTTYQDATGVIDLAATGGGSYTDEQARDAIGAALVAGNNIDITVNDGADTITIDVESLTSADVTDFAEAVDDRVSALLVAGNNIDLTYNDGANTLTVDVEALTSADLTDFSEAVDDRVSTLLVAGTNISLTYNDGANTLTIANTAGGGGASVGNPLQTRVQRQVAKTPGAVTAFQTYGYATPSMAGTLSAADDADGPWVNCATSTTLNNTAGFTSGTGDADVRRDWLPDTTWAIKTDASAITGLSYWIGHSSTALAQNATPGFHYAAFRYHTTADGTAFWRCVTDNASGTPTVTVTTAAIAANTKYVLRIDMSSGTDVKFYVDTVLVATHTTTLPTATQPMGNQARVVNLGGGAGTARAIRFGRLGAVHRP